MREELDLIAELERQERFWEGKERGERAIDVLRGQGMDIPVEGMLDDAALHTKLWQIIEAMAELGLLLDCTDHLSDRELYRFLLSEALAEEMMLPASSSSFCAISPIGGCSNEDVDTYIKYYADEKTREEWPRDPGESLLPKLPKPFDRDRVLPGRT